MLIEKLQGCWQVTVHGDAMQNAGIKNGDIVNFSTNIFGDLSDKIILATVDNKPLIRRVIYTRYQPIILRAANLNLDDIVCNHEIKLKILGVLMD